jgi:hypothetical protein
MIWYNTHLACEPYSEGSLPLGQGEGRCLARLVSRGEQGKNWAHWPFSCTQILRQMLNLKALLLVWPSAAAAHLPWGPTPSVSHEYSTHPSSQGKPNCSPGSRQCTCGACEFLTHPVCSGIFLLEHHPRVCLLPLRWKHPNFRSSLEIES